MLQKEVADRLLARSRNKRIWGDHHPDRVLCPSSILNAAQTGLFFPKAQGLFDFCRNQFSPRIDPEDRRRGPVPMGCPLCFRPATKADQKCLNCRPQISNPFDCQSPGVESNQSPKPGRNPDHCSVCKPVQYFGRPAKRRNWRLDLEKDAGKIDRKQPQEPIKKFSLFSPQVLPSMFSFSISGKVEV